MAQTQVTSPTPPKRRRWPRVVALVFGILITLLVALYFVGTSSGFFKGVILPRASKQMNANITVSDAHISPFKQVVLRDLKVQPRNAEPVLIAPEVRARYSLMDILRGNIHVEEAVVVSPTITIVENADGTKNIDALLKPQAKEKEAPSGMKPSKPMQLDIKKIAVSNATLRHTKNYQGNFRDVTELSNLTLEVTDVKNGQSGKLTLKGDARVTNNPPPPGTNGLLQAKMSGDAVFALANDLTPTSLKGNARFEVTQAAGAMSDFAGLAANFDADTTPTEIKQLALRFQRSGAKLGEVIASGPFDVQKQEGKLNIEVRSIDRQVLNLVGAKSGIDFGTTKINSTNQVEVAKSASLITARGGFEIAQFQLTRTNQTTPTLDLRAQYDVTADLDAKTNLVRRLTITGMQKQNQLLLAELTKPMALAWGEVSNAVGDAALNLTLNHLNIADWKPFVGDMVSSGVVDLKGKLLSQEGGKKLSFDLNSKIENLTAGSGSNQITQATVTADARGQAFNLKQFKLDQFEAKVARQNQQMVSASGSGTYDGTNADLQVTVQANLPRVLEAMPRPDVAMSSGMAELKGRVTQKEKMQTVTGALVLADLTGKFGKNEFRGFGTTADLDVVKNDQLIQIRKATGKLTEGGNAGGSFDISGQYNLDKKSGQITAKLTDVNQNGLRAFLEPMLADKKLVSISLNGTASAQYDPQGDSAVKADVQLANLVVRDPQNQISAEPLEARLQMDTSLRNKIADVRQFQIGLKPTARAKNELRLQGQVDMTQTNALRGNLKLAADSLDVTRYYDLFAGDTNSTTTAKASAPRQPSATPQPSSPAQSAPPQQEPEAKQLPFRNFALDASIGRFYLRELEITNLQAKAAIEGSHVVAKPIQMTLNGAPVSATADVDLGVPGYKYEITFNAQHVPFAPIINTFEPERKGQIGGTLNGQSRIAGRGITEPSLQKNLNGQFDIATTNLNLAIPNLRSPTLKAIISVIAIVPDLIRNRGADPQALVVTLLGGLSNRGGGGLMDDLMQSPLDIIVARGVIGTNRVNLERAFIQSPAFQAEARGSVKLEAILTNSTLSIPLSISLKRSLAEKIDFVPANTPTNQAYVKLPDYVSLKGTVGKPKPDINKMALLGTALQQYGGKIPGVNTSTSNALGALGGLLTGRPPAQTNAGPNVSTNQPATNQSPALNLLDQLLKPKKQ
jgi:uncharacterized protein involved in outer membrane biogenesis